MARPSVWGQVGPRGDGEDGEGPGSPVAHPCVCPCPVLLAQMSPTGPDPADRGPGRGWCVLQRPEALTTSLVSPPEAAPSAPGRVLASRDTKTSVVVQWDPPRQGEDLLGYYVDCCVAGSGLWEPCTHKPVGYTRCRARGQVRERSRTPRGQGRARRDRARSGAPGPWVLF